MALGELIKRSVRGGGRRPLEVRDERQEAVELMVDLATTAAAHDRGSD